MKKKKKKKKDSDVNDDGDAQHDENDHGEPDFEDSEMQSNEDAETEEEGGGDDDDDDSDKGDHDEEVHDDNDEDKSGCCGSNIWAATTATAAGAAENPLPARRRQPRKKPPQGARARKQSPSSSSTARKKNKHDDAGNHGQKLEDENEQQQQEQLRLLHPTSQWQEPPNSDESGLTLYEMNRRPRRVVTGRIRCDLQRLRDEFFRCAICLCCIYDPNHHGDNDNNDNDIGRKTPSISNDEINNSSDRNHAQQPMNDDNGNVDGTTNPPAQTDTSSGAGTAAATTTATMTSSPPLPPAGRSCYTGGGVRTKLVRDCLHRFCNDCIEKALRLGKSECPMCRTFIPSRRCLAPDAGFDLLMKAILGTNSSGPLRLQQPQRQGGVAAASALNHDKGTRNSSSSNKRNGNDAAGSSSSSGEEEEVYNTDNDILSSRPPPPMLPPPPSSPLLDFCLKPIPDLPPDMLLRLQLEKPYIRIRGDATIGVLQEFLRLKLNPTTTTSNKIMSSIHHNNAGPTASSSLRFLLTIETSSAASRSLSANTPLNLLAGLRVDTIYFRPLMPNMGREGRRRATTSQKTGATTTDNDINRKILPCPENGTVLEEIHIKACYSFEFTSLFT